MANALIPNLYGGDLAETGSGIRGISLQFHITAACDQNCKHCYMHNSDSYRSQIENPLSKEDALHLIDEYFSFLRDFNCAGAFVALTGGDPILSPYFWDILEHTHNLGGDQCTIVILGNPFHITPAVAKKMKDNGVSNYQISIDGLKETHDALRKPGSFDDSMRALEILHDAGINTIVAMTISKLNCDELIPLYEYLSSKTFVDCFGFDRMIPVGNGEKIRSEIFSPEDYRQFLFNIYKYEIFRGTDLTISKKEQLWKLLFLELGLLDPIDKTKKNHFVTGCSAGTGFVSVLADGTILLCSKLSLAAGKYPEKNFRDIFINNDVTKMLRQHDRYENCSSCSANIVCRGCPAMKFAVTGNYYGCEPYCWR